MAASNARVIRKSRPSERVGEQNFEIRADPMPVPELGNTTVGAPEI